MCKVNLPVNPWEDASVLMRLEGGRGSPTPLWRDRGTDRARARNVSDDSEKFGVIEKGVQKLIKCTWPNVEDLVQSSQNREGLVLRETVFVFNG